MNRRRNEHRRRSGCWACKKKHVQCTEERPTCFRCVKSGLDCQYGIRLLWKEDAAQRNICLGREGKWNKTTKKSPTSRTDPGDLYEPLDLSAYAGEWIFLNVTKNDFDGSEVIHDDMPSSDGTENEPSTITDPVLSDPSGLASAEADIALAITIFNPGKSLCALSSFSSIDGNLFDYFVKYICPSCSLSPSQNPYLSFLAPMSFEFPVLRNSLLAASANQLRLLGDRRFEKEAWSHKSKAIQGVQIAIDSGHVDVGIVATVLMLCFYDISDGCNRSWVTHLRGGISLLDKISQTLKLGDEKLLAFLRMYFVAHDIMSRTACDEDIVDQRCEWVEDDTIDEIDVVMGCSRGLMNLVRQISSLASHAKIKLSKELRDPFEVSALVASRDALERSLHSLEQTLPTGSDESSNLSRIAETKRLTALLYLRERLGMLPSTLPQNETAPASSTYRIQLITSIISLIKTLPNSSTLLWPLFILGNTSSGLDESQRRFVHERLTALQKVRNLGSVRRARLVVEDTWKKIDLFIDDARIESPSIRRNQNLISLA